MIREHNIIQLLWIHSVSAITLSIQLQFDRFKGRKYFPTKSVNSAFVHYSHNHIHKNRRLELK